MSKVEFEASGADEDATWVAADVPDAELAPHEEPDSRFLGYRSFVLPREVLNRLTWRELSRREVEERVGRSSTGS